MRDTTWTIEKVEALKRMWCTDGLTASQIASRLGFPSRSAVCGKAFRLGLSHRNPQQRNPVKGRRVKLARVAPVSTVTHRERVLLELPKRKPHAFKIGVPKLHPIPETSDADIPLHQRKALLDLEPCDCRWPIGDPQSPEFAFCGGPKVTGLPYCETHAKRAYQAPEPRQRTFRKVSIRALVPA